MRWRIVPLLMLFAALAHFNRISMSVAGAEKIIAPDFIGKEQMGLVYSAFLLLYTIFMIPGGWFIDRCGPRAAWMVVGFGSAAGAALTGAAGLVYSEPAALLVGLLVVRSLMGMCNSPLHPCGARLVANWIPPAGASLANGLINCAALLGIASTYLVFGTLIDWFGWPKAFLVAGAVTLLVSLVWTMTASDHPPGYVPAAKRVGPAAPGGRARRFLLLLGNRSLACLTVSYGLVGYFQYLFFYWAEYYFKEDLKYPDETSRWITTLLALAMGAGMVLGGWVSDRAAARWGTRVGLAAAPVAGLLLATAATLLAAFASERGLILLCLAVALPAVGLSEGSFWTVAVRIGGRLGGTAAAVLNTGGNAGGLLAPALAPVIADLYGWGAVLAVAGLVCFGGAVLWWGVIPDHCLDEPAAPGKPVL
jgi:MFS family permease